jgi:predicted nucleotidyltransferase
MMTLDDMTIRLSSHAAVEGIVLVGSGGRGELAAGSDYDLLVVLADNPIPLSLILTTIDHRVAEVVFRRIDEIERLAAGIATVRDTSREGGIVHRFADGRMLFDRTGRLARSQTIIRAAMPLMLATEEERYAAWFNVNYELRMLKYLLKANDPVHLLAVDYRLLSMLADLWPCYFTVRRLPWRGEKAAIRYLSTNDPAFLDLFRTCLSESDRWRKVEMYEELARRAVAPVGELWAEDATAADGTPVTVEDALDFWAELLG